MADNFPQYPATSFDQAVDLTIFTSNQLGDVINGDATSVVNTESGEIPTIRKALIDNFYFKNPIQWNPGNTNTVFNQLYVFDTDNINKGWYYAPTATLSNPILMGTTPVGDANWKLYSLVTTGIPEQVFPWYTEITQTTSSIVPPYEFDTAIVTFNGITLVPGKDYTIANNTITFTPPLVPEPDAEVPDILFCYIGKVQEGDPSTNYVTYSSLAAPTAAGIVGTSSGETVESRLNTLETQTEDYLNFKPNIMTLKASDIITDGMTDQTVQLQSVIDYLESLGDYWVLDGHGETVITSSMVEIDLCKVGLKNITIKSMKSNSSTATYILQINGSSFSDRRDKGKIIVFEKVELVGPLSRNTSNVHGLLISPDDSIANAVLNKVDIRYVNMGVVLDSNCYLISFENLHIHNCNICLGTKAYATYLETGTMGSNLSNAGENIRFRNTIFSDSNMCARLAGIEAFITFDTSSFDYTGGNTSVSYKQWTNFRQGTSLNFFGCHFEAGNSTDNWTANYFEVDTSVAINLYGGATRHSDTYNACPYFFYDSSTFGQFSIEGTNIWGSGVLTWSNRGMSKFYPMINVSSSVVRGYLSEKSDLITDPNFSLSSGSSLIDNWQVTDGTRTGAVISDVLSCEVVSHTDGAGVTYSALKITKLKASSGATLRLYVKAPRSDFAPVCNLSLCADSTFTPAGTVTLVTGFAKTKGVIDSYGLPVLTKIVSKVSTTISSISNTMTRVNARGALTKSDDNNGYDYLFLSLNLGGLSAGDIVYITNINIEIPKRA